MAVKWTEEQQKVISLKDRNILVSAAAGSGKTAVLVERIIRKLTDEDAPSDVDRLLIVTFTEAAAAEMKERIGAAIEKKLAERPGDAHLERQETLIHSASITTIHSFCLSVIRENFHVIGIDPGFRIGEEGELKLLKQDVLDELLEERYAQADPGFLEFVEKLTILASAIIITTIAIILGMMALFYLSFSLAYIMAPYVGGLNISFAIITVVLLLLLAFIYLFRKQLIVRPLTKFVANLFINSSDADKEQ